MITNEDLENLHNAALLYNELRGRDYLIGYGTNSRKEIKLTEIRINPQNFWHLLGYRIKDNIPADTRTMLYTMVLINSPSDIETLKNSLDCLHGKQIRDEKYNVFMKEFNFIYNAKIIDLANTQNTPDVANFDFAMGNDAGIIGYKLSKRPRDEHKHMPASVQTKSINKLNKPVNDIFLIFSKNIVSVFTLEDFRRQGVQSKLLSEIINYAKSLNITEISLETDNDVAVHMYKKCGFVQNNLFMTKQISEV